MTGGDGADQVSGDAGNDTLAGGAGADSLFGGAGNDTLVVADGDGADALFGGEETGDADVASFVTGATGPGVTVTYTGTDAGTYAMGPGSPAGSFSGIEVVSGTEAGDVVDASAAAGGATVRGNGGADSLTGGGGADSLDGGAGDDTLAGGGAADTLAGGDGADSLAGDGGADSLAGGLGADRLRGGAGDDTIATGGGADVVILDPGGGADRVTDFDVSPAAPGDLRSTDQLDVSGLLDAQGNPGTPGTWWCRTTAPATRASPSRAARRWSRGRAPAQVRRSGALADRRPLLHRRHPRRDARRPRPGRERCGRATAFSPATTGRSRSAGRRCGASGPRTSPPTRGSGRFGSPRAPSATRARCSSRPSTASPSASARRSGWSRPAACADAGRPGPRRRGRADGDLRPPDVRAPPAPAHRRPLERELLSRARRPARRRRPGPGRAPAAVPGPRRGPRPAGPPPRSRPTARRPAPTRAPATCPTGSPHCCRPGAEGPPDGQSRGRPPTEWANGGGAGPQARCNLRPSGL